ncbi:MAG: PEP-utilizing enzyme [Patescibacteria group bacterium]
MTVDLSRQLEKMNLRPEAGVYRALPVVSLSCIAQGFCTNTRQISGMSYLYLGGIGNNRGFHSLVNSDYIVRKFSSKLAHQPGWFKKTRRKAYKQCHDFTVSLIKHEGLVKTDPIRFIRFILTDYPKLLGGIGTYNLFWRYLDLSKPGQSPFPRIDLSRLGKERDTSAKIYPHCEHLIAQALRKVFKPYELSILQSQMMTRSEMLQTLWQKRLTVSKDELRRRRKGYVYLWASSREVVQTDSAVVSRVRRQLQVQKPASRLIQGTPVSPGRVVGVVVCNLNRQSWPTRPVYVTNMTRPDDVKHFKRVKAVVTDEGGGILSHAAVITREFGIPGIVGTKLATKIFKDGDRVEVDATKGIVRKI